LLVVGLALAACTRTHGTRSSATRPADTGFAAMQVRGQMVMGVDQYTSTHVFEDLADGGRILLERQDASDTAGIAAIRAHMRTIASAFRAGDFAKPFQVHAEAVPGTDVMTARASVIDYEVIDRPSGAAVRIRTRDSVAIAAIHAFLAFQRSAHHAAGHEGMHDAGH
jgi:limonene-1,2-epoxide hydrolase